MPNLETMSKPSHHEPVFAGLEAMDNERFSKLPAKIAWFSWIRALSMNPRDSWHPEGIFMGPSVESDLFAHRFFVRAGELNLKYERHRPIRDKIHEFELLLGYVTLNSRNEEYKSLFDISRLNRNSDVESRIRETNREIDELDDEMAADGLPPVTDAMKDEARRIVRVLARQPATPTVYGTRDGDIAIQFDSEKSAVVIELSSVDGRAACFSHVGGKNQRAHYNDSKELPDEFVEAQLRRLSRELGDGRRAAEDNPG